MKYVKWTDHVKPVFDKASVEKTGAAVEPEKKKRPAPISMRFNEAQLAKLKPYAGNKSLGVYCRDYILQGHNIEAGSNKPGLYLDQISSAQILREIGLSSISENLHSIRTQVQMRNDDDLFVHLSSDIAQACADVAALRSELMKSLNVHDRRNV